MKELIVALDLELNQPSRRVVQIGAVLGNVRTGEVVSQFDVKVNPGELFSLRIAGSVLRRSNRPPVSPRPDMYWPRGSRRETLSGY
jgi:hypothetical protein